MEKVITKSLLIAALLFQMSVATAKSDNASVGTKELLARIEALESAVGLNPNAGSVVGSTYRSRVLFDTTTIVNDLPINVEINGQVAESRIWTFEENGVGTVLTPNVCEAQRLITVNDTQLTIEDNSCIVLSASFTYSQTGNEVTVEFFNNPRSLDMTVSNDGETFILNGVTLTGSDEDSDGDGVEDVQTIGGYISIGVRTED